jgi:hypothetical protein
MSNQESEQVLTLLKELGTLLISKFLSAFASRAGFHLRARCQQLLDSHAHS